MSSKKVEKRVAPAGPDHTLPVYSMPHDEQVDLLAQALLREYMHKKGFKETLAAFDEENPRNERTISSRAVMGDLMALDKPRQEELKGKGADTIMQALCYTRAEKRERALRVTSMRHLLAEGELAPQNFPTLPEEEEKPAKKAKKAKKEKADKKEKNNKNKVLSIDDLLDQDTPLGSKKIKKKKSSPELRPADIVVVKREIPDAPFDGSASTSNLRKSLKANESKRNVQFSADIVVTLYNPHHDDVLPEEEDPSIAAKKTLDLMTSNPVPLKKLAPLSTLDLVTAPEESSEGTSSESDASTPSKDGDYEDVVARTREDEDRTLRERHMRREGSGGNLKPRSAWGATPERRPSSDVGTPSPQSSVASSTPSPHAQGSSPSSSVAVLPTPKANALGSDLTEELMVLLVGGDRRVPSSFMNQGFYFNESPAELQFGLLQNEGGCCGVLAAVQAVVLTRFVSNHFIVTPDVQRTFLLSALADILLIVQPDMDRVQLVTAHPTATPPIWDTKGTTLGDQRKLFATQFVLAKGFASRAELEDALGAVIPHCAFGGGHKVQNASSWCEPRGYGLMCFLLSCVLSHGIAAVSSDMDVQSPIIVEHGYCSQELVNLMLCGRATSNVHDGVISHGSMDLKGLTVPTYHPSIAERAGDRLLIGFLSALEPKGMLEVGIRGKDPAFPVWIIYNESHYTVAWLPKDVRDDTDHQGEDPSVDVHYYDQQGGQDEDIRLTLTLDDMPLPAVHRDALVPYLNPILRTVPDWALAKISWNGTDPLL